MKKESACTACKYQRQKCKLDCPARYVPGNDPRRSLIMHKLFGHCNILKALNDLKTLEERDEMMRCRQFEAESKDRDPVRGAAGRLADLLRDLALQENELRVLKPYLNYYRSLAATQGRTAHGVPPYNPPVSIDGSSCIGGNPAGAHAAPPGIFSSGAGVSRCDQNPNPADAYLSIGLSMSGVCTSGSSTAPGIVIGGANGAWAGQSPNLADAYVAPPGIFSSGAGVSRFDQNPNLADAYVAPPGIFSSGAGVSRFDQNPNLTDAYVAPPGIFSSGAGVSRFDQNPNLADAYVAQPGISSRGASSGELSIDLIIGFYGGVGLQEDQGPAAAVHVAQGQPNNTSFYGHDCWEVTRSD